MIIVGSADFVIIGSPSPIRQMSSAGLWKNFGASKFAKLKTHISRRPSKAYKTFLSSKNLNLDIPRLKSDLKHVLRRQTTVTKGIIIDNLPCI